MLLRVENLTQTLAGPRGRIQALDTVSFTVNRNEFVAIQGPSGCGKTTLLLTVGTLFRPTAGRVLIDTKDPYAMTTEARGQFRAEHIGFVFQQFHLVPYLTVLENVLSPSIARPRPGARERARELLRNFNLEHRAEHVPALLSTGERQRTALARALFHKPMLILADEPTGNLDDENGDTVLRCLSDCSKESASVLMVTHDARAGRFASRTLRMVEGQLAQSAGEAHVKMNA